MKPDHETPPEASQGDPGASPPPIEKLRPDEVPPPPPGAPSLESPGEEAAVELPEVNLQANPDAILAQVLEHERRRARMDIPRTIKIGDRELTLTARSLGQNELIWDEFIKLARSGSESAGEIMQILQDLKSQESNPKKVLEGITSARLERMGEVHRSETMGYIRICQILVEEKGHELPPKDGWSLTEEEAKWGLGMDQIGKMILAYLVRDMEGLAYASKKAVELGGLAGT